MRDSWSYVRNIKPFGRDRCKKGTRKCGSKCVMRLKRTSTKKLKRCPKGFKRCANFSCAQSIR